MMNQGGDNSTLEQGKHDYSKSYPLLRLLKTDIEKLVHLFENHCPYVEIVVDGQSLERSADIDRLGKKRAKYLLIRGYQGYLQASARRIGMLQLELTKTSAKVYLTNASDVDLRDVVSQIDTLFSKKVDSWRFSMILLSTTIPYIMLLSTLQRQMSFLPLVFIFLLISPWNYLIYRIRITPHAMIFLTDVKSEDIIFTSFQEFIPRLLLMFLLIFCVLLALHWLSLFT